MSESKNPVTGNPWHALRQFTAARIALGRAGVSQPTAPQLEFQLAHARARDAVHHPMNAQVLAQAFDAGLPQVPLPPLLLLHSAAENRGIYLQRPDLGRRLDVVSRAAVPAVSGPVQDGGSARPWEVAFVIADGLSALAIERNALPFMQALMPRLSAEHWRIAPLAIVRQGRVALGDEVGELLGAQAVVVLIGERPGLSSPDSMGIYLTWQPRMGLTDASRNCISNVRPAGMSYAQAAHKLHYLLSEARRRGLSGVELKDETGTAEGLAQVEQSKFLL
jgi:ethanolamine ammonia-lyase small subunit